VVLWGGRIKQGQPEGRPPLTPGAPSGTGATASPKRGGQSSSAHGRLESTRRRKFPYPVLFGLQQRLDERCYPEGPAGAGSL
jgi:hypothetical protein